MAKIPKPAHVTNQARCAEGLAQTRWSPATAPRCDRLAGHQRAVRRNYPQDPIELNLRLHEAPRSSRVQSLRPKIAVRQCQTSCVAIADHRCHHFGATMEPLLTANIGHQASRRGHRHHRRPRNSSKQSNRRRAGTHTQSRSRTNCVWGMPSDSRSGKRTLFTTPP